jgi:uncharacterized protein YvpB
MRKYWFIFFTALVFLWVSSCTFSKLPVPVERTATFSLDEIVTRTLAAYAHQLALTPQPDELAQAPGEEYSVEVTQVVPAQAETPVAEDQTAETSADKDIPASHYIWNIWGHRQYFPIGCEASAARDWAWYFGVDVNEFNFQMELPVSDNPDLGFVGSVEGPWGQVPPYAYGVHAAPVAQVLHDNYGMPAEAAKGYTIEAVKNEIAADRPVIAWVIGNCVGGIPYEYTDQAGNTVVVAAYEHVVIITGYNEETLRYMNNGKFYDIPYEYFENSWSVLGKMAVYLADE